MDDLKFPIFKEPLPPAKKVGPEAYFNFLIWHLNRLGPEERRLQLARRPHPTGKRFTLFP